MLVCRSVNYWTEIEGRMSGVDTMYILAPFQVGRSTDTSLLIFGGQVWEIFLHNVAESSRTDDDFIRAGRGEKRRHEDSRGSLCHCKHPRQADCSDHSGAWLLCAEDLWRADETRLRNISWVAEKDCIEKKTSALPTEFNGRLRKIDLEPWQRMMHVSRLTWDVCVIPYLFTSIYNIFS